MFRTIAYYSLQPVSAVRRGGSMLIAGGAMLTRVARIAACLLLFLSPAAGVRADKARPGLVQFSNGEVIEGKISLAPGKKLRIHDGDSFSMLTPEHVREIRFFPDKEKMERKWRFPEAGKTRKERFGKPYPVRYIHADVLLKGARRVSGHLYTTAIYVEGAERTHKVVLRAKQRGGEGTRFEDLVYPVRIAFMKPASETAGDIRLSVDVDGGSEAVTVCALTYVSLVRLEGRKTGKKNEFLLPSALGSAVFVAVKREHTVWVGWPGAADTRAASAVAEALDNVRDFFDEIELLGVCREGDANNIYSLLMLSRKGKTTLHATRTQPWRLGLWRWKEGEDGRLMLAGRNHFFRGITSRKNGETPWKRGKADQRVDDPSENVIPVVRLSPKMWNLALEDGIVVEIDE